jgi:uroporphyrinogen III methyltransferase/synthase
MPGTVYLVGAGPGDPGLLTVRALELIQHADVVLHDHLVSAAVLAECRPLARVIDVGKIGHGPQTDQAAIERHLVAFARCGDRVVRLKGGDPLLFGHGCEEVLALRAANVPFEIVPGVSSAVAAPAYAGIPLTARGLAASVAIVTGHCAASGALPAHIPPADTIVVLMGIANAQSVRDRLMAAGRRGDTPAAVVEWATCAEQRVTVATLATLPDVIRSAGLRAPAVIVIGETVRLRPLLDWLGSSRPGNRSEIESRQATRSGVRQKREGVTIPA